MMAEDAQTAFKICLSLIATTINEAQVISRASVCCMDAGYIERAFNIFLDAEPLLAEANSLLQAASKIRRSYVEEQP